MTATTFEKVATRWSDLILIPAKSMVVAPVIEVTLILILNTVSQFPSSIVITPSTGDRLYTLMDDPPPPYSPVKLISNSASASLFTYMLYGLTRT